MIAAPCITPVQPKCPNSPLPAGRYGFQWAVSMNAMPATMNSTMIATLITTIRLFRRADWRMPM